MPIHETKLWLQMAMQVVLVIFSVLLFVFSRTKQDEAVQILLSLAEVFVIIYQVSCLIFQAGCTIWEARKERKNSQVLL